MRAKHIFLGFIIFSFGFHLCFLCGEEKKAKVQPQQETGKPLVLREMLRKKEKEFSRPKRDIFSPQDSLRSSPLPQASEAESDFEKPEALTQDYAQKVSNLRYIGYIRSPQKILGLIFLEGQALAVSEGGIIGEGIKILKVTAKELEVLGPDSKTHKFVLEGEGK